MLARNRNLAIPSIIFSLLIVLGIPALGRAAQMSGKSGKVYIVLWFDTEDYILPQSDDAALRIANLLTGLGVRATFKVVGEKGRTLERRGRTDVIAALKRHEIGYHSNTHSQHPTVAEYEEPLDWESGVEEFDRREHQGYEDLTRIFGQAPTCYGQPGSSWAPQSFAALKQWGVHVYLDEADQVGLDGKPFWYGGLLNIFNTREGGHLRSNEDWSNMEDAKIKFREYYARMTSDPAGGLISIYFHPAEFIHAQFWDAANFLHGANPPRDQWKVPALKSPEEIEKHFKYLEDLVTYLKSFPQVRFVTASEALDLYRDAAQKRAFSADELADIARQIGPEFSFQVRDGYNLSASEQMELLNQYVAAKIRNEDSAQVVLEGTPYGPSSGFPEMNQNMDVPWNQFSRTVQDVEGFMEKNGQVPTAVWFGSTAVPPESYLVALAGVATTLMAKGAPPSSVAVGPARLTAKKYVADDSPKLWGWVIFPVGFRAPNLMALAKLQAWTLKPARLRVDGQ
jgi:peptidoglycan/xylan/chitin deacetylase (PgdA/CDA1 family)